MSFGSGGDFDRNNPSSGGGSANAFGASTNRPEPRKSNTLWWILGILGFLTIGGAILCCGGGYFMIQFTSQVVAEEVKRAVSGDAAIQEHIGTISNVEMNLTATGAAGGNNKLVFDVTGDKGAGQLEVVVNNTPQGQTLRSCTLVLPDGERHEVVLDVSAPETTADDTIDELENADPVLN
jgi:hypothetical protein